jgi:hypothetical protein
VIFQAGVRVLAFPPDLIMAPRVPWVRSVIALSFVSRPMQSSSVAARARHQKNLAKVCVVFLSEVLSMKGVIHVRISAVGTTDENQALLRATWKRLISRSSSMPDWAQRLWEANLLAELLRKLRTSPECEHDIIVQCAKWVPVLRTAGHWQHRYLERWRRRSPAHERILGEFVRTIEAYEDMAGEEAARWLEIQKRPAWLRHQRGFARWITRTPIHVRAYLEMTATALDLERVRAAGLIKIDEAELQVLLATARDQTGAHSDPDSPPP